MTVEARVNLKNQNEFEKYSIELIFYHIFLSRFEYNLFLENRKLCLNCFLFAFALQET